MLNVNLSICYKNNDRRPRNPPLRQRGDGVVNHTQNITVEKGGQQAWESYYITINLYAFVVTYYTSELATQASWPIPKIKKIAP